MEKKNILIGDLDLFDLDFWLFKVSSWEECRHRWAYLGAEGKSIATSICPDEWT